MSTSKNIGSPDSGGVWPTSTLKSIESSHDKVNFRLLRFKCTLAKTNMQLEQKSYLQLTWISASGLLGLVRTFFIFLSKRSDLHCFLSFLSVPALSFVISISPHGTGAQAIPILHRFSAVLSPPFHGLFEPILGRRPKWGHNACDGRRHL